MLYSILTLPYQGELARQFITRSFHLSLSFIAAGNSLVLEYSYIQYLSSVDRYMLKESFLENVCHEMVVRVVSRLLVRLRFSRNVLQIVIFIRVYLLIFWVYFCIVPCLSDVLSMTYYSCSEHSSIGSIYFSVKFNS